MTGTGRAEVLKDRTWALKFQSYPRDLGDSTVSITVRGTVLGISIAPRHKGDRNRGYFCGLIHPLFVFQFHPARWRGLCNIVIQGTKARQNFQFHLTYLGKEWRWTRLHCHQLYLPSILPRNGEPNLRVCTAHSAVSAFSIMPRRARIQWDWQVAVPPISVTKFQLRPAQCGDFNRVLAIRSHERDDVSIPPRHARGRADFLVLRSRPEYRISILPRPCRDSASMTPVVSSPTKYFNSTPLSVGNATSRQC